MVVDQTVVEILKPTVDLLGAFTTPVIAVVVAYIAYQQYQLNKDRSEKEIRASKIAVYKRVRAHLDYIDAEREVSAERYNDFYDALVESDFLFSAKITDFLQDIDVESYQWLDYKKTLDSAAPNADPDSVLRIMEENEQLIDALQNKNCELLSKFRAEM